MANTEKNKAKLTPLVPLVMPTIFGTGEPADSAADDMLNGDNGDGTCAQGNDYLNGEDGNDDLGSNGDSSTLFGGEGDDRLYAGGANSYLDGEAANDASYINSFARRAA